MRLLVLPALIAHLIIFLLSGCGGPNPHQDPSSPAVLPFKGSLVDEGLPYYPERIIVGFRRNFELPREARRISDASIPQSALYQNKAPACFARFLADEFGLALSNEVYVDDVNLASFVCKSASEAERFISEFPSKYAEAVRYAEYDGKAWLAYVPNDPDYPELMWGMQKINPEPAWDQGNGDGVRIAILDTGMRYSGNSADSVPDHEDLADNVLDPKELWPSYNFDLVEDDKIPNDTNGHGTHVAGTAAAVGDNATGVLGVAYRAKIVPIKVLDGSEPELPYSRLIQAIALANEVAQAKVINMSLGGFFLSRALHEEIQQAANDGVILVASAMNFNNDKKMYPAAYPEVIAVGATDSSDARASFSNFGDWVDVAAPGVGIRSTWHSTPSSYNSLNGTSMSAPHVAGAAALLFEIYPSLSATEVRAALEGSGVDLNDSEWGNPDIRRLDVGSAVNYVAGSPPTVVITSPPPGEVSGTVAFSVDATDSDGTVQKVEFYAGSYYLGTDRTPPFGVSWDTTHFPNTSYTLSAIAIDDKFLRSTATITVSVNNDAIKPDYFEDFESGASGWWTQDDNGQADWHLSTDRSFSPTHSFEFGDQAGGNYHKLEFDLLYSPVFTLDGITHAKITFYHFEQLASGDYGFVTVNLGDGEYYQLKSFTGFSTDWEYDEVSLDDYLGKSLQVVFIVKTDDDTSVGEGWWIDDFLLKKASDPPAVSITAPSPGQVLSGTVRVSASASDDVAVTKVDFYVDSNLVFSDYSAPYEFNLDTTYFHGGDRTIKAVAYDEYPLIAEDSISVIIKNHQITSFSPSSATADTLVNIDGSLFLANGGDSYNPATDKVRFTGESGKVDAEILSWQANRIRAYVPKDAVDGAIFVEIGSASVSSSTPFTILPKIDALNPNKARVGDSILVEGSGFLPQRNEDSRVFFGELLANEVVSWSNRVIEVTVPSGVTPSAVKVATKNGTSNSIPFTPIPNITSLSRYRGHVGALLTIYGTSFGASMGSSRVVFTPNLDTPPANILSWSDSQVILTVPQGAETGPLYLVVNSLNSNEVVFVVTLPPPSILGISQY